MQERGTLGKPRQSVWQGRAPTRPSLQVQTDSRIAQERVPTAFKCHNIGKTCHECRFGLIPGSSRRGFDLNAVCGEIGGAGLPDKKAFTGLYNFSERDSL